MPDVQELKVELTSSKITDRRKAIKVITKEKLAAVATDIFSLYLEEKEKNKSWEIQCELIECLGILDYKPALPVMESICAENAEHDMITAKAAGCFLRLSRSGLQDIAPITKFLKNGKYAVVSGVLGTMGTDKMNFTQAEIESLLSFVDTISPKREKGYADIRIGIANACAGWEKGTAVQQFLQQCAEDAYVPLQKVANNALKGKYSEI